jgi:glycosyltransferase involved in cell wall biosynthesis
MKRIDIMFPVYHGNLHEIEPCVKVVVPFFTEKLSNYNWRIVFAINGKDAEKIISLIKKLNEKHPRIWYDYAEQPGKGSGVIHSWSQSPADIITYMDVDLATDIGNFPKLIEGIENGFDICIGSRYHPDSKVDRSLKRKIVSVVYHRMFMKFVLGAKKYTDAQCGYKAVTREVVLEIIPLIRNKNWFFESEMMYIAQYKKMKILEIPVIWKESRFSGITLYKAIWEFIKSGILIRFRKL